MITDKIRRAPNPPDIAASRAWSEAQYIADRVAAHPAPEQTATLEIPFPVPGGAARIKKRAERNGWRVVVVYGRGTWMHATGRPGEVTHLIALQMARPPAQRAVATWRATVVPDVPPVWQQTSAYVWGGLSTFPRFVPLQAPRRPADTAWCEPPNLNAILGAP